MKSERMARRASFGNKVLKKLSDITNLQSVKVTSHEEKLPEMNEIDRNCVDQLVKERRNLLTLLSERNQIIELNRAELRNLRVSLQKLQLQNWNLAQSNSHMLAEINVGRDKVKALQHELMCKDALLKVKNMRQEGIKAEANFQHTCHQERDETAMDIDSDTDCAENPRNHRRRAARTMGASTTTQKSEEKEKLENKRRKMKRQSARFMSHEREPKDDFFEIEDAKIQDNKCNQTLHDAFGNEEQVVPRRASIGRPSRRAAVRVQSYREVPLNVKMRRHE